MRIDVLYDLFVFDWTNKATTILHFKAKKQGYVHILHGKSLNMLRFFALFSSKF